MIDADAIRDAMTDRQLAVVLQYARTTNWKETAAALGITEQTAKNLASKAMARMGARGITHACAMLVRAGLA